MQQKSTCAPPGSHYNRDHVAVQQSEQEQQRPDSAAFQQPSTKPYLQSLGVLNMLTAEQIVAAQKANIETLFGLTQKAFEGVEKLVELNVQATKAALSETANSTQALLSVKDAQELLTLQASLMQPLAEKTVAYSRHLYDIASGTTAEFSKAAEAQATDAQKKFMSVVDNAAKNAPAGSETAVAVMKSAVSAANNAMESVQKAVKQATEMAEANFNSVTTTAVNASKTASKKR
jgi:phasin family protein